MELRKSYTSTPDGIVMGTQSNVFFLGTSTNVCAKKWGSKHYINSASKDRSCAKPTIYRNTDEKARKGPQARLGNDQMLDYNYLVGKLARGNRKAVTKSVFFIYFRCLNEMMVQPKVGIRNLSPQLRNIADNQIDCGVAN
jgi:hypothetical protein